jgi:hypothetical protein
MYGPPEHLQILEPLGMDQGTFVARDTSKAAALVVVERVTAASPAPAARAELLRRGRALRALEHPKVVRVRDVFERDAEVLVVTDYVDGEWLASLMMMQPRPPLGVMLRLVIDVLEGLGALHGLRDERDQPLGFVHGALGPDTVLVAEDGVAEIAGACRLPRPGANERYVAPELRRGKDPPGVRSDVYAAGCILRDVLADAPADVTWAEPLTDIAWRACAVDPENRWPSALAMATTVRRVAGSRLATATVVAEVVRRRFGEKIRGRRAALEMLPHAGRSPSSEPLSLTSSEMELLDPPSSPTLVQAVPLEALRKSVPPPHEEESPPPPTPREQALARIVLVKKPAFLVEADVEVQDEPEPATKRKPSPAAPRREATVAVAPAPRPRSPSVRAAPREDPPEVLEAYRRQMPTFPTFEQPPRRRAAMQALVVGGAILLTFVLGWWLGRKYAPAEAARPEPASVTPQVVATMPSPAIAASPAPSVRTLAPLPATSSVARVTPTPSPAATPTVPPVAPPIPTSAARPAVPAHRPVPTAAPDPDVAPKPAPKPSATHGGYVPEEL